jgi:hypothetical protein
VVVFTVNGQRTTENDLQFFAQNNGLMLQGFLKSKKIYLPDLSAFTNLKAVNFRPNFVPTPQFRPITEEQKLQT